MTNVTDQEMSPQDISDTISNLEVIRNHITSKEWGTEIMPLVEQRVKQCKDAFQGINDLHTLGYIQGKLEGLSFLLNLKGSIDDQIAMLGESLEEE